MSTEENNYSFATSHIPETVFGRAIKDPAFRAALMEDPKSALDAAGIYISGRGLAELEDLLGNQKHLDPLRPLEDVEFW